MKLFLLLCVFCSFKSAIAHELTLENSSKQYEVESLSCSNGNDLLLNEPELFTSKEITKYQVNEELSLLTSINNNETSSVSYELVLVGKNTYMAVPTTVLADHSYFFVNIDPDDTSFINLLYLDSTGKVCDGGLIVHNLIQEEQIEIDNEQQELQNIIYEYESLAFL